MIWRFSAILPILLIPATLLAQTLDLHQAQRLAIERNLNLRAQEDVARAAEALVRGGYGIYNPRLEAEAALGETKDKLVFSFTPEVISTSTEYRRFGFSLIQLLPYGTLLQLDFDTLRNDLESVSEPSINPSYDNAVQFSLVQPLLQGLGRTMTEREILFTIKDRDQEIQNLREATFNLVADVRNAYYDVLRFRDNVAFRETSVSLATEVLKENRARVEAGVLPPVETLEAEVGVQLRERELLDAQRAYQDALDALTLLLNAPEQVSVTEEALRLPPLEYDEEKAFHSALALRPDVYRRLLEIERLELVQEVARNDLLPELNLAARYGQSGLRDSFGNSMDETLSSDYPSWEVGLTLSYELGNTEARNGLIRARQLLRSNRTLLAQLKDEIRKQIEAAIRNLEVNRKKVEVTELAVKLARERLQTLLKRKEVGLATTRDVLEGEEDLAQARTDQIAALADYNQAVTEYLLASGQLLQREGIRLADSIDPTGDRPLVRMRAQ